MKKYPGTIRSFVSFTRTERSGILLLCGILIVLIIIRAGMHLWVKPAMSGAQEQQLVAAWQRWQHDQPGIADSATGQIDINTADSATLVRIKGIGPVTAARIIADRNENGPFTDLEQLWELGYFSETTFDSIKTRLRIGAEK